MTTVTKNCWQCEKASVPHYLRPKHLNTGFNVVGVRVSGELATGHPHHFPRLPNLQNEHIYSSDHGMEGQGKLSIKTNHKKRRGI